MWLARPIYESLPYVYMLVGAALLTASWFARDGAWSALTLIVGCLALIGGLVVWLRRRDFRSTQARYNSRSLDD